MQRSVPRNIGRLIVGDIAPVRDAVPGLPEHESERFRLEQGRVEEAFFRTPMP